MFVLVREAADAAETRSLVDLFQHGQAGLVPRRRRRVHLTAETTLVGELDGTAVAIGSIGGGPRHPRLVEIAVDAKESAESIIAPLVDALVDAAGDRIVAAKGSGSDPVLRWVRDDPRFTHEITVVVGTMPTSDRPPVPGPLPAGYTVETFEETTPDVERLFERVYAEGHAWTGEVVEFPDSGSWLSGVGEPVAIGVVWSRIGEAVGISGVAIGDSPLEGAYLIPGGVLMRQITDRVEIMGHAIDATLAKAARLGVPRVAYEDSRPDYALQGEILDRFERNPRHTTELWLCRER